MIRRPIRVALVAALALAVTGAAIWMGGQRPLTVAVVRPSSDARIEVFGLGTIEARIVSQTGFEVAGTLVALDADVRDYVPLFGVLARLENAEQRARLARAEAGVDRAHAEIARAEAKLDRARAHLAQRRQVDRRRQELLNRAAVSVEVAEDAKTEVALASADLAVAGTDAEVARAALRDAQAQLAVEAALLAQHTLTAPYDAVVVRRHRERGAVVAPGEPVFTLIDPASVWALVHVDEQAAGSLRVGQPAEVVMRSLPGLVLPAKIARIDLENDRVAEERRVFLAFDQPPADFHLGEQAEARIHVAQLATALLVPEAAVTRQGADRGEVWTLENGRLARRAVRFGHKTLGGQFEVVDGLPPGAAVVATPQDGLRSGRLARPADAGP